MGYLDYEFFDEYKSLDSICRDIYGDSPDKKLGVTLYLEDMERSSALGTYRVPGWTNDYTRLKKIRNLRNELAHGRTPTSVDICSEEDIDFVRSFKSRILELDDPLAHLQRESEQPRRYVPQTEQRPQPQQIYIPPRAKSNFAGRLVIALMALCIVACIIIFLLCIAACIIII